MKAGYIERMPSMVDRMGAIVVVFLLHVALTAIILQEHDTKSIIKEDDNGLRLRFIARRDNPASVPTLPSKLASLSSVQNRAVPRFVRAIGSRQQEHSKEAVSENITGPLRLTWVDPEAQVMDFGSNSIKNRKPSLASAEPHLRFKLRKSISGKDVVEGVSKLIGLWPPGYTTDPCPEIRRNIGNLMSDASGDGQDRMQEELRREQAYCR